MEIDPNLVSMRANPHVQALFTAVRSAMVAISGSDKATKSNEKGEDTEYLFLKEAPSTKSGVGFINFDLLRQGQKLSMLQFTGCESAVIATIEERRNFLAFQNNYVHSTVPISEVVSILRYRGQHVVDKAVEPMYELLASHLAVVSDRMAASHNLLSVFDGQNIINFTLARTMANMEERKHFGSAVEYFQAELIIRPEFK